MMHNIGPFHVNGNVLTKHGRTVGEPAMLIMRTEDFCVPVKIGSKEYISVSYQRFIRTRKDQAHQVHFLVFDTTKLSIDAVCTVFNAAMNSAGDGVLEMLLDENVAGLMQYVDALQKAGYWQLAQCLALLTICGKAGLFSRLRKKRLSRRFFVYYANYKKSCIIW